jgi:SAM-dependent methyltransferase
MSRLTRTSVVDAVFSDRRLAGIYDPLDPNRVDLDAYVAMVDEFGVRSVLDVGCGTGIFACSLARRGVTVIGVDPAAASLDVARRKPGADRVRWVRGDVGALGPLTVDMATMTGNAAQVFVTDEEWLATLTAVRAALRPRGLLVLETRDPAREAWRGWTREETERRVEIPGVGAVLTWTELIEVTPPLISFRASFIFEADGVVLTSSSTLRFRNVQEMTASLHDAGFFVEEVREAPDRLGLELVFIARRASGSSACG